MDDETTGDIRTNTILKLKYLIYKNLAAITKEEGDLSAALDAYIEVRGRHGQEEVGQLSLLANGYSKLKTMHGCASDAFLPPPSSLRPLVWTAAM